MPNLSKSESQNDFRILMTEFIGFEEKDCYIIFTYDEGECGKFF